MVRCVAKLTDDLVAEILSRLPTRSFFRFQCISKSWLALSSDPCYQNKFPRAASGLFFNVPDGGSAPIHRARRGIQYISLSNNDDDLAIDTTLNFLPNICNMEVLSSCNGLLLCRSWVAQSWGLTPCGVKAQSIYVCNPATSEWVIVPKANDTYNYHYLALGFDPRLSRHYHVLCFDFYKILRFMIFSSETNEWVVSEVFDGKNYHEPQATFFHGIFHFTNGLNQVLGVDPEGKICRRIELPESDGIECLGLSGGYLHYMLQSKDEIKVWMLKDYSHVEWVLKSCINIRAMLQNHGIFETQNVHGISETQNIHILEFHPDVDVVFLRIKQKIFSYHLNSGRLEEVGDLSYIYGPGCAVYSPRLSKGFGDEVA
ncbi:F-box protein At5g49610-like [Elaeis guineensis]|uniref:F-box protein At5g49610-like n=1 Tax=Elaeis guineensis var. tenera TaxID=51953 RepID=A0A6I9S8S9_ELAGV|nr:F-box protein At5g49610-like [Elaeis guineensis]